MSCFGLNKHKKKGGLCSNSCSFAFRVLKPTAMSGWSQGVAPHVLGALTGILGLLHWFGKLK